MLLIESQKLGRAVFYGVSTIFIFAAVSSLLFSLILRFTDVKESSVNYIILFISFLSLFVGGFISGGKGKRSGWMLGGAVGLIYTLIVFLYQYLGLDTLFSGKQIIYYISYVITAMMGGILGVNVTSGSSTR